MWNRLSKLVTKYGAGIIALAAILLAAWEGYENRRHNRLTVAPKLDFGTFYNEKQTPDQVSREFKLVLESSGLGQAVITSFFTYWDGQLKFNSLEHEDERKAWSHIRAALKDLSFDVKHTSQVTQGVYLRAGSRQTILTMESRQQNANVDFSDRFGIAICYCSVYNEACTRETFGNTPDQTLCHHR
ncbi:MAG: hypothetical protein HRU19_05250 [Pseudobacteriovorax sp.]|nr:hypothetical protein [Pseudobacteriovorax sp.]